MEDRTPQEQANCRCGRNGLPPPPEHRFQPGQSGNPGGRPAGQSITAELRQLLAEPPGLRVVRQTKARILAEGLYLAASKGNAKAAALIFDRVEGRLANEVRLDGGLAVEVAVPPEAMRERILAKLSAGAVPDPPAAQATAEEQREQILRKLGTGGEEA